MMQTGSVLTGKGGEVGMRWFFCKKCGRWHRTYPATVMYCPFCGADITEQEWR